MERFTKVGERNESGDLYLEIMFPQSEKVVGDWFCESEGDWRTPATGRRELAACLSEF